MIGLLRLVGLLNAGVWFGAAVFYTIGVSPVTSSEALQTLLGANNHPYYGPAVNQLLTQRFYHLSLACSIVALLHLTTEWVYLGRVPRRRWPSILAGLFLFVLAQSWWLQPSLQQWHKTRFLKNSPPAVRQTANRAFNTWQSVSQGMNLLATLALAFYLWRMANPPDSPRFVSTSKFRS